MGHVHLPVKVQTEADQSDYYSLPPGRERIHTPSGAVAVNKRAALLCWEQALVGVKMVVSTEDHLPNYLQADLIPGSQSTLTRSSRILSLHPAAATNNPHPDSEVV